MAIERIRSEKAVKKQLDAKAAVDEIRKNECSLENLDKRISIIEKFLGLINESHP